MRSPSTSQRPVRTSKARTRPRSAHSLIAWGDPEDIAAEARERLGIRPKGSGWDVVALIMLLVGGVILPVIGWIIGVVLLWVSETWTTREKLVGTLVVPGGLALPIFIGLTATSSELCSSYNG